MAETDSIQRRSRTHPQSTGKRISLQPRDMLWLQKLHEHGPLPSSFLLEYCRHTHASAKRSKERLTDLFNENNTPDRGSYLTRPPQQFRTLDSRYNPLVYDLTKSGRHALKREGDTDEKVNVNAGPWVHRLMVSCITASIELACQNRDDVNYISGARILKRAEVELRCPVTIAYSNNPEPLTRDLLPDGLFGLEYVSDIGSTFRFFVIEADRSTEPATTGNFNRKSFVRNLLQYQAYVERGAYRDHLGLTAPMMVLNVTCDEARLQKMAEVTAKHFPTGNSYVLFQSWEDFGPIFKPPAPKHDLLHGLWKRAGMEGFNIGSA